MAFGLSPEPEVGTESPCGIITEVDDPVLPPFGIIDDEPSSEEVYGPDGEVCHLSHPEAAAKHEHEHGPIPRTPQGAEQHLQLFPSEMLGKGLGCSEAVALSDWVCHRNPLLLDQVMVELPDPLQVAVDGLRLEPLPHELVDILRDGSGGSLLNGHLQPHKILREACHIVGDRSGRAVLSL